jgi:uncharacterized membrane protein YagU involved in acid resistance
MTRQRATGLLTAILLGGFVAGSVDVGAASLIFHAHPDGVLRAIASGLIGAAAKGSGLKGAALGLVLQWLMGMIIAAIYDVAALALPILSRLWIAGGLAYGVAIYFVMNDVVVPLSAAAPNAKPGPLLVEAENMAAMLLFGLIVAFFARKLGPRRATTPSPEPA